MYNIHNFIQSKSQRNLQLVQYRVSTNWYWQPVSAMYRYLSGVITSGVYTFFKRRVIYNANNFVTKYILILSKIGIGNYSMSNMYHNRCGHFPENIRKSLASYRSSSYHVIFVRKYRLFQTKFCSSNIMHERFFYFMNL